MSGEELPPGKQEQDMQAVLLSHAAVRSATGDMYVQRQGMSAVLLELLSRVSQQLLSQAAAALQRGEHQLAVLLSQAAHEWATEEAIRNLMLAKRAEYLSNAVVGLLSRNSMTLHDRGTRQVYEALTGDCPAGRENPASAASRVVESLG